MFLLGHKDISRIDPKGAKHCLNIDPTYHIIRKKQRRFASERNKITTDEVDRLLGIDAIEPCQ